jgi:hypothetical protein
MSLGIHAIGFAILIGGLIYGAYLVPMPAHWIVVGAGVLLWDSIARRDRVTASVRSSYGAIAVG